MADQVQLSAGEVVWQHARISRGWVEGRAAVVVPTPEKVLWQVITDYSAYVEVLPYVTASHTISTSPHEQGMLIESSYELTTRGVRTLYRLESILSTERSEMPFCYTAGPGNIEDGGCGIWRVRPWSAGNLLLEVIIELPDQWWLPRGVERQIAELGLPKLVNLMRDRAVTLTGVSADQPSTDR